jgi:hypothetical protein
MPEEFVPPPGAEYSIDFGEASSFTVTPGHVLALRLKVRREDGFEAPIDLAAHATPGIVVIFRPERVIHLDESDLLVVADASTPRRTHQIEFTAASEGHPTMTAVLSLTVVDPE